MKVFFLISLIGLLSFKGEASSYPISDHYDGSRFFNPNGPGLKSFWSLLKWKITSDQKKWPESVAIRNYPYRPISPGDKVSATFINHSTFLLEFQNLKVITDPVYSERASPLSFAGPKRVKEPGLPFDVLPPIDVVIVSHNHYDHMDLDTLKKLDDKFHPLFILPIGNAKYLSEIGIQNIKELDWWEEMKVKDVTITLAPAQHWSARGMWDKNDALWGSFMLTHPDTKVYFAGDTGYNSHFSEIKLRLGAPDLSLIPIGAYKPEWFMQNAHINPFEAVQAHLDLGSKRSVGMHFGTFQMSDEGIDEPVLDLKNALDQFKLGPSDFQVLDEGQAIFF